MKNKTKTTNTILLIVLLLVIVFVGLYFSGALQTVFTPDSSDITDIKVSTTVLRQSSDASTFITTATVDEYATSDNSVSVKPNTKLGITIKHFNEFNVGTHQGGFDAPRINVYLSALNNNIEPTKPYDFSSAVTACQNAFPNIPMRCTPDESDAWCACQQAGSINRIYGSEILKKELVTWDLDPTSTYTISRNIYSYSHTFNMYNCIKSSNSTHTTWACADNIVLTISTGAYPSITVMGVTPSDIPTPYTSEGFRVSTHLIFHKPGTYLPPITPTYIKYYEKKCYGNDVYWYDNEGTAIEVSQACLESESCTLDTCTITVLNCEENVGSVCYNNNLYYVDGCSRLGGIKTECNDNQVCVDDNRCIDKEGAVIVIDVPEGENPAPTSFFTKYKSAITVGIILIVMISVILLIVHFTRRKK